MSIEHPRLRREITTLSAMIRLYCAKYHSAERLCPDCRVLSDYARTKLEKCPFQEGKPTCAKCPVHCYQPAMREKIRAVMRYAGPRMIYRHPALALLHLVDSWRKKLVSKHIDKR